MASNYVSKKYNVDIVFCIDATMSMYQILDKVKENTKNFYIDLTDAMAHKGKKVDQLRVRIVMFRDYYYDKEDAMFVTDFFNLPAQSAEFDQCVNSIEPKGGGDDPEDALEALAYAIRSDWTPADPEAPSGGGAVDRRGPPSSGLRPYGAQLSQERPPDHEGTHRLVGRARPGWLHGQKGQAAAAVCPRGPHLGFHQ